MTGFDHRDVSEDLPTSRAWEAELGAKNILSAQDPSVKNARKLQETRLPKLTECLRTRRPIMRQKAEK